VTFGDSSAPVPLCLEQPRLEQAKRLLRDDKEILVWSGSAVECASAAIMADDKAYWAPLRQEMERLRFEARRGA